MHGNAKYYVDPSHRKPIPTGHFFRRGLHPLLIEAMRLAARQATTTGTVNLSALLPAFQQLAIDNLWHYTRDGMRQAARELLLQTGNVRRKSLSGMVLKNIPSSVQGIDFSFDLLRPEVVESIRRAAFDLAQSTLETAATEANRAIQAARATLEAGVKEGASTRDLNRAFFKIFADPYKAARVAQSEASRAFHSGALEAAKASEVVTGMRWLASSDACPLCLELNGKTVKLGEAFVIDRKAKPAYQRIEHPPRHPHCFCTTTSVLLNTDVPDRSVSILQQMAFGGSGSTGGGLVLGGVR